MSSTSLVTLSPSPVILSPFAVILSEAKNLLFRSLRVRLRSPSLSKVEGRVNSARNLLVIRALKTKQIPRADHKHRPSE
jgi:hypothetical protein